jgi:hypothetical protein
MIAGLLITTLYCVAVWLVFFRFKLIRFTAGWGIISGLIGLHVLLIFLIGIRFVTPSSIDARVCTTPSSASPGCPSRPWSPLS